MEWLPGCIDERGSFPNPVVGCIAKCMWAPTARERTDVAVSITSTFSRLGDSVGTEVQLRSRRVRCLGDGGFLQRHQLHQVKTSHRRICHGALLDKYKSCLLMVNQKAHFHFVSMVLLFL